MFAFDPGGGGLLASLFADPATGNPLEGETLLWARVEGPTLIVYSLSINQKGGFNLERNARTVEHGAMTVRHSYRFENDRVVTIEGRLERVGG